jgi:hypothetical protein
MRLEETLRRLRAMRNQSQGLRVSAPRSSLTLTGASPVWTTASHQSSTKSHRQGGNELPEAERREVAGCNVSEGRLARKNASSRWPILFTQVQAVVLQPIWRGCRNPAGSQSTASYHRELRGTRENQSRSSEVLHFKAYRR